MRLLLVPLFVLGLSPLALAQTHDDGFVPHDCIKDHDCQECDKACERRNAPPSPCNDPRGCWNAHRRNQYRVCVHDVCGWPAEPWHEPETSQEPRP